MLHRHQAVLLLATIMIATANCAMAQSFTSHISAKEDGKATVTVFQSKEIETLVNSRPATADNKKQNEAPGRNRSVRNDGDNAPRQNDGQEHRQQTDVDNSTNNMDIPTVDMRKKMMRNSYKMTGYRVQAYAGRNSKADRMNAEKVGNAIKMKYPDQPVYVHFYSPRWICRVGNYRSYEEAAKMLHLIQEMGFTSATIVKGQITVKKQ